MTAALAGWVGRVVVVLVAAAVVDLALPSGALRRYVEVVVGLVVLVTVLEPVLGWLGADLRADLAAAEAWLERSLPGPVAGAPGSASGRWTRDRAQEEAASAQARWQRSVRAAYADRVAASVEQGLARDLGIQARVAVELAEGPGAEAGAGWGPPPLERVVVRVVPAASGGGVDGRAAGPWAVEVPPVRVHVLAGAGMPGGEESASAGSPGDVVSAGAGASGNGGPPEAGLPAERIRAWVAGALGIDAGQVVVVAEEVEP